MFRTKLAVVVAVLGSVAQVELLAADKDKPDSKVKAPDLTGIIAAVSNDGRTITLELPPKVKGDPPTTTEIKVTDQTKFSYFGVDSNGENPTVGYVAQVWLADGSTDRATGIRLGRKDGAGPKGPDFTGILTDVAKDGKTLTIEVPPADKTEKPQKQTVKLTDQTKTSYFGVPGAETPTVGYVIQVWLKEGSKEVAVGIRLGKKE